MTLSKRNLNRCFENATTTNALFIGVQIETRGSSAPEVIINPRDNFLAKLEYYRGAYNDDLVLKTYDGIKIVGLAYGDCYDDIECEFEELN